MYQGFCIAAKFANHLAKKLRGTDDQAAAYRVKSEIAGAMLLAGMASVNGVRANGTLAVDLSGNPSYRLHVPFGRLSRAAQGVAREQLTTRKVRVVAPLHECLKP